jgi:hypothetical protein
MQITLCYGLDVFPKLMSWMLFSNAAMLRDGNFGKGLDYKPSILMDRSITFMHLWIDRLSWECLIIKASSLLQTCYFTMLLKKKFTDADHISVPNFWTSQYPEL